MEVISWIISLISGVIGGNIAGAAMPDKNLGTTGNSVVGLIGGGLGSYLLHLLGLFTTAAATATATTATGATPVEAAHAFDLTTLLANIGGSGASGAILTAIVAFIKDAMQQKSN